MTATKLDATELVVNGITYVPKGQGYLLEIGEKRIIIADKGFVFVGSCRDNDDGSVTITNAKCLRRWGTTAGLGQLLDGPTKDTIADPYGTVRTTPVASLACTPGTKW